MIESGAAAAAYYADMLQAVLTLEGSREPSVAEAQAMAITELAAHAVTEQDGEPRAMLLAADDYSAVSRRVPVSNLYERGRSLGIGMQERGHGGTAAATRGAARSREPARRDRAAARPDSARPTGAPARPRRRRASAGSGGRRPDRLRPARARDAARSRLGAPPSGTEAASPAADAARTGTRLAGRPDPSWPAWPRSSCPAPTRP